MQDGLRYCFKILFNVLKWLICQFRVVLENSTSLMEFCWKYKEDKCIQKKKLFFWFKVCSSCILSETMEQWFNLLLISDFYRWLTYFGQKIISNMKPIGKTPSHISLNLQSFGYNSYSTKIYLKCCLSQFQFICCDERIFQCQASYRILCLPYLHKYSNNSFLYFTFF